MARRELYEKFFRTYTRKQWGRDPSELDRQVTARVPTRTNNDDRYFSDAYQYMPKHGYTRMFERMPAHPNIRVMTNLDYRDIRDRIPNRRVVYTGPIDEFFDHRHGRLPYRSLRFKHVTRDAPQHQRVAVVNYPQTEAYTRIIEYKHLTGQVHAKTALTYEYPSAEGNPNHPVPTPASQALYKRYEDFACREPNVVFAGRLATFRYYNMDQTVGQALAIFKKLPFYHGANERRAPVASPQERASQSP